MTSNPRIPMHPRELPRQRITLVASLPPRPAGFVGKQEPQESVRKSAKMPRSAKYIGQFEWAWSPMNARISAYYLSTNRERTHWFIWLRQYDDNWGRWDEPEIDLYAPKEGVPGEVAAAYLLLDSWAAEAAGDYDPGQFHWINNAEFLSVEELHAIARVVWPKSPKPKAA